MSLRVVVEKAWTLCVALGGMESCASCRACPPLDKTHVPPKEGPGAEHRLRGRWGPAGP